MAQAPTTTPGRLSADAQKSLVQYCQVILDIHKKQQEFRDKLTAIDIAYARFKADQVQTGTSGIDVSPAASEPCGVNIDDITVPVVVSQVDSYVGYLQEVYLSGYPIFPVVSTPDTIQDAEKLQAIIDDHAIRGRYPIHLGMSFKDDIKYNFSAIEIDWCPLDLYNITQSYMSPSAPAKIEAKSFFMNKMKRWDPYNTIADFRYLPVEIPYRGEYAGEIELISRVELKRLLSYYEKSGNGYHTAQALSTTLGTAASSVPSTFGYYTEKPQISELINNKTFQSAGMMDWVSYLKNERSTNGNKQTISDVYELITLYARIIPEEHKITNVPKKGTPQIWKLVFVNHEKLVYAKRIFTIYDTLPVYFSQPFADGFGLQTKSIGESAMPFQEANSKLFSIRLNAARRAVADRGIYDPNVLSSSDINSPYPAAKIPIKANSLLAGKKLEDVYKSIPFDPRGTETTVQDMRMMNEMADRMNGVNQPQQGQFQKGNKSRKEWDDTMQGAHNRMRAPALMIEFQKMLPIKEQLKLNIYQHGVEGTYQNMVSGELYEITAQELDALRKKVNNFKLADGFIPADKLASTEVLVQGMQFLQASPILQATFGMMLPKMFLHMMSQGGVQNMDKYMPTQTAQPAPAEQTPAAAAPTASGATQVPQ